MIKYTINEARSIAIKCAAMYDEKLNNKQFIIIYRDRETNLIRYIEMVFQAKNYQHLTGLLLVDEDGNTLDGRSEYFYRKCLDKKLSNNDIAFKRDGTTYLKLEALPIIISFTSISKITGDSNDRQPFLYVDKIVGGVNFCMGLRFDDRMSQYVPVSAMQRNIKELTDKPSQILAIMERSYGDASQYRRIRHVAKGTDLSRITLPNDIGSMITLGEYVPRHDV